VGEAPDENSVTTGKPFSGGAGGWLNSLLSAARIPRSSINVINTIGCCPPDGVFPGDDKWHATDRATARAGVEYCRHHHLMPAIAGVKPSRIVALGEAALQATTPRAGITHWRGSPLPLRDAIASGPRVIPTFHPAALMKQPNMFSTVVRDLKKTLELPPENYNLYPNIETVRAFTAKRISFDFEWGHDGEITMCGLSDRFFHALVVPWCPPYIDELRRIFESAEILIGHNIVGADTKYFERMGWNIRAALHDTMLAQHLIQPDMRHGLGFVASVFTNKVFWKGTGEGKTDEEGDLIAGSGAQWKTWAGLDAIPREFGGYGGCGSADEAFRLYNARDTEGTLQAELPIFATLKKFGQEFVYWNVSVPAAYICREMNDEGLRIDHTRLVDIRTKLQAEIDEVEQGLPEGLRPYEIEVTKQINAPPGTFKQKTKRCKGSKKAGTSHVECELIFTQPGSQRCPDCGAEIPSGKMAALKRIKVPGTKRIVPWNSNDQVLAYAQTKGCKPVKHQKTGNDSADKRARKVWGREHTEFATVDQLKKAIVRRNSFAKPGLLTTPKVYFNLMVTGTSEGRLSCAGQRDGIDPNIQNQPKDIRKIFIPDQPGYGFLSADVIQGENMLTAWLAQDHERLERLHTVGYDEHADAACRFFKIPVEKEGRNAHFRKAGKIINHGRNYGLGVRKTMEYLAQEGFYYSQGDVAEMIEEWKRMNPRTARWQQETIELAQKQGYLENPFGRRRWFQGRDFATKALAFLPASTLADVVLRMMIAFRPDKFAKEIMQLGINVVADILPGWRMAIQVHDEITFCGPEDTYLEMARRLHAVMTQPWPQLGGFKLGTEVGWSTKSWGEVKTINMSHLQEMAA
jgi:uracil-DNA glycosylase family 4